MDNVSKTIEKINDYKWLIPKKDDMRVPVVIYASESILEKALTDNTPLQLINVSKLKGITKYSLGMPDVHWGYGAPIGGVGGFDAESGIISPGFVGYDINCGVRLLRSDLIVSDVSKYLEPLINTLFNNIPSGVGSDGQLKLKKKELEKVLKNGSLWALENGFGSKEDAENIEDNGRIKDADPNAVSNRAYERGATQLGTLGSGNHFLEIQQVSDIYDEATANAFGIFKNQITVMLHSGSRGLGYQVCDDYLAKFGKVALKYNIKLPDRQLACAPINSPEGKRYFGAMSAAANYAFANRQIMTHFVRETFESVLKIPYHQIKLSTVYDVAHNICKKETHNVDGIMKKLYVHRKGATRAFPKQHPDLPDKYKPTGQPVMIPGTMGTASYILIGTEKAMEETWGSTCHGAGRVMSRKQAIKASANRSISSELAIQGIIVRGVSRKGLAEEMPEAYKDVDEVIETVEGAGISKKVAKMTPIAVMKG
jgi:tRNA-splicing ligase RtcB